MKRATNIAAFTFMVVGTICYAYLTYSSWKSDRRLEKSMDALDNIKEKISSPVAYETEEFLKGQN